MNPSLANPPPASAPPPGRRPGVALAVALLLVLAFSAAVRWPTEPPQIEEIVQLPVPNAPSSERPEPTAPDPGDNP